MNSYANLIAAFCTVVFWGCGGNGMRPSELKRYVEDPANGFVQTLRSGPYEIRCIHLPPAYLALRSFRGGDIDAETYRLREAELSAWDMYRLEVRSDDTRDLASLSDYFGFYMQDDLRKICGTDTLPCAVYRGEAFHAVEGRQRIEIGFENGHCPGETGIFIQNGPMTPAPLHFRFHKTRLTIPLIALHQK